MLKITIQTDNIELTDRLTKYVNTKVGALEKYIPRTVRSAAHAEVRLKRSENRSGPVSSCDILLSLPHEKLYVCEATEHPYAAIDITVAHFRDRLATYKSKYMPASLRHKLAHKIGISKHKDL